jgi:membrane-associated phospholipid phosphatase
MNGSNRVRPADVQELDEFDALIRGSLWILAAYLLATAVPLVRWSTTTDAWSPLITHVAALGVTVLCLTNRRTPRWVREWMPLALVPVLYVELRWIIAAAARPHEDFLIAGWDRSLFGGDPSRTLALRWPFVTLSELLHLCYLSYYAIVYVPPAILWLKGRHRAFASTVLAIIVMYTICFLAFVLFPVDGPRFMAGPSAAPYGPIRSIVVQILQAGSSRGTAFPSAHVAASVVAGICALRFQRPLGIVILLLTAGMMVGAVYGGYHYAVDVIAGLFTGVVASVIAGASEHRIVVPRSALPSARTK